MTYEAMPEITAITGLNTSYRNVPPPTNGPAAEAYKDQGSGGASGAWGAG